MKGFSNDYKNGYYFCSCTLQLEALQATVESLREEIRRSSSQTVEENQQKNKAILQQEGELQDMKVEYEGVQKHMSTMRESMDEIVELIEKLFKLTDFADSKPVLELLGNQQEISEKTAMLFLNILENRIGDLFMFRVSSERNSRMAGGGGLHSGRGTPRSSRKTGSEHSMPMSSVTTGGTARPMIVLDRAFSDSFDGSEVAEEQEELLEAELNPMGYLCMRGKVMDSASSIRSGSDNESVISNVVVEPATQ